MLQALLTNMRYVIGDEGKIDFSKTQEVTSDLERLVSVLHLAEGEISVSVPHLDKAISVLSEVFTFKKRTLLTFLYTGCKGSLVISDSQSGIQKVG